MVSGERLLWQAVLNAALTDVLLARFTPAVLRCRLAWFRVNNPDFQMVCYLADSDPKTIRSLLLTLLSEGDEHDIKAFIKSKKNYTRNDKRKNKYIT
jgi:hypothetical protein